jgi:cysteine desulfurase
MKNAARPIYLDHNASTPLLPGVLEAMLPYLEAHFGNPSSTHVYGQKLQVAIKRAREQVARLIGCTPAEVYFTSGGTEANNLAIRGVARACPRRRHLVTSVIEHPATSGPCHYLEQNGYRVSRVAVDDRGQLLPDLVKDALCNQTALLTVMHSNSETGTLQPIPAIATWAHRVGALVHTDAAQSCGKVKIRVEDENVDLLSIAGHKLYAPPGIAALFVRKGTPIQPLVIGAGHESGLRPGTENVAAIVGLGEACRIARKSLADEGRRVARLRDRLWNQLRHQIPGLNLNGHPDQRLPNTLNVRFPGVSGTALLAACPEIAASTGSACHESGESASSVILAMGVTPEKAIGSVRLTLGRRNTVEEIDRAADLLANAWHEQIEETFN